ncbi:MAG: DUF4080 domain-containing protein [Bacteroidales bacterium]|nr:DUF4080 domain-containing protein [Bacteroidales bacterium]
MNILWLDLNSSYSHSSLALPAIHAQCNDSNSWDVLRTTINVSVSSIVGDIVDKKPDLICATAWLFTHDHLKNVLSRVKSVMPNVIIALGGPEFLGDNQNYLFANRFVDIVFRGEGEESFCKWLNVFDDKRQWKDIVGVCYLDIQDKYIDNGYAKVGDFKSLNPPEDSEFFCRDRAFVQFETARGCFNTCSFCVSGADKPVRVLPLERVRERLQSYYEMGIKSIRLLDRTFNGQSSRALAMLDIFEEFAGKLVFHLEVHPALLSEQVREKLVKMPKGVLHLEAGIQSLRQNVLTLSKRLGSLEDSLDGLGFLCGLKNMETHVDLIAGLPGYTLPMMKEDILQLAAFDASEIQLELLKVLPGTEMRRNAENLGLKYAPMTPYEILESDGMSVKDLFEAKLLSRLLDMYYNNEVWQSVFREIMLNENEFLNSFFDYMKKLDVLEKPISLENRGLFLYNFLEKNYPSFMTSISMKWIEEGLAMGKKPALNMKPEHVKPNIDSVKVAFGEIVPEMRFYSFNNVVYGYDRASEKRKPVFKCIVN